MWVQVHADKKREGRSGDEKAENRKVTNLTDTSALHSKCPEIKAKEKEKECHLYLERLIMPRNQIVRSRNEMYSIQGLNLCQEH